MYQPRKPDPLVVEYVRREAERTSVRDVAKRLRFAQGTICRLAAGLPVTEGTDELARIRIERAQRGAA